MKNIGANLCYKNARGEMFDYRASRLLVGIVAMSLPFLVAIKSGGFGEIDSISSAYHTDARDIFVGSLFVVGAFLLAYNGHYLCESIASKLAAISAFCVAYFPTSCDLPIAENNLGCPEGNEPLLHAIFALSLFFLLAYFCLGPFYHKAKGAEHLYVQAKRRKYVYLISGYGILSAIALTFCALNLNPISSKIPNTVNIIYIAEFIALLMFGFAWIVAGKYRLFSFFVHHEES